MVEPTTHRIMQQVLFAVSKTEMRPLRVLVLDRARQANIGVILKTLVSPLGNRAVLSRVIIITSVIRVNHVIVVTVPMVALMIGIDVDSLPQELK